MLTESPLIDALHTEIPHGGRYLVAVSGGADSVALLHAAVQLTREGVFSIEAAHVNHQLREAADADASFVHDLCFELGVELHTSVVKEDPPNGNIEAWGRVVRYRFFRDLLSARDLDATITAHTANDVVETLLMRLVSNKELYSIHKREENLKVIRPFLGIWREHVDLFLKEKGLKHVEDASNQDTKFLRNRIRHEVVPLLSDRFDGDIKKILWEQARTLDEDLAALMAFTHPYMERIRRHEIGSKEWLRTFKNSIIELPEALKWRLVDQVFRPIAGFGYGRDVSDRIAEFILGSATGIELPGKLTLRRKDGGIKVIKTE